MVAVPGEVKNIRLVGNLSAIAFNARRVDDEVSHAAAFKERLIQRTIWRVRL